MKALIAFLIAASACTTGGDDTLPDASLPPVDAARDAATADTGLPRPTTDPCTAESRDSTLGMPCAGDPECDDGCFCNGVELCVEGECTAGADPCVDEVDCTEEVCLEETDTCFYEPLHEMCSDGDACNGYEVCDIRRGCRTASPLYCNDENSCTVDSCDSEAGCVYTPRDLDGDGFVDARCGGDDCDDDPRVGAEIYPGAAEDCTNRRDDDCDGLRDYNDTADCSPTNGDCASAVVLPGAGTYSGSTAGLSSSYTLGCGSGSGPDAVFRFTLTEMQDVRVSVSGGGTGVRVALREWAQCASGPDEKCGAGSPPSILRRSLPAGDYAIIVKTTTGAPFDLTLSLSAPTPIPPVDVCDGSTMDVSSGGTFTGMFAEVDDDYSLSCHSGSWKDAAYVFTITEPKDVVITGSTSGAAWTPRTYLALTTDCSDRRSELTCRSSTSAEIRRRSLPAGTYYVLLESSASDATGWTLEVSITDPAPRASGDACSTALDITSAMQSVSLGTAELDSGTTCGGARPPMRDVYFYFDLASTRDVSLTTTAPTTHYVSVQTTCGDLASELRCRSGSTSLSQTFRSLPAGRYYVAVATTRSSGSITASITTSDPTPIPPNDRCSGAITLTSGSSRTDTLDGFEDDTASCSGIVSRPDAFYTFTLSGTTDVTITARRAAGGTGRIYLILRDDCATTANIACSEGSGTATITETLDAGTYYLIVEMPAGAEGEYDLLPAFF